MNPDQKYILGAGKKCTSTQGIKTKPRTQAFDFMNIKRCVLIFLACTYTTLLCGCFDDLLECRRLAGKYYLIATTEKEDQTLSYEVEFGCYVAVVDKTVFAVGYNDKYIFVKQHPDMLNNKAARGTTNYYIIPIFPKDIHWVDSEAIGPMTRVEFERTAEELGITTPRFSVVYKDLE